MGEVAVCNSVWINACHLETWQIGLKDTTKYVSEENRYLLFFPLISIEWMGFLVSSWGFFGSNQKKKKEMELSNIYNTSL